MDAPPRPGEAGSGARAPSTPCGTSWGAATPRSTATPSRTAAAASWPRGLGARGHRGRPAPHDRRVLPLRPDGLRARAPLPGHARCISALLVSRKVSYSSYAVQKTAERWQLEADPRRPTAPFGQPGYIWKRKANTSTETRSTSSKYRTEEVSLVGLMRAFGRGLMQMRSSGQSRGMR